MVSQYYGSIDEEYLVDLSSVDSIVITTNVYSFFFSSASLEIYYSYDSINVNEFNHTTESIRRITSSNIEKEYGVTGKYCSIDLELESLSTNAYVVDIKGKNNRVRRIFNCIILQYYR